MRGITLILLVLFVLPVSSQEKFGHYFTGKTMRYDFLLAGNSETTLVYPQQIKEEPFWGGSQTNLIDRLEYGTYRYRVFDAADGELIFSRGFCNLFQEWQTTAEAKKRDRVFYQAIFFPFPKQNIKLSIEARNRDGKFVSVFETEVDPNDYFIVRETPQQADVLKVVDNGPARNHVDLVFIPEGYTAAEKEKFNSDVRRMCGYLFAESPFRENQQKFNVTAVWAPSDESGTDVPGEHIYRNTRFNSTFYTFDLPRYLTTSDMKPVYDAAAGVPWDQLFVLVNTDRYGGGGFYNFLSVSSADHPQTPQVLVHEFGHGFAGLGDEYYNSEVAYEDFYNLRIEPWEPNLTTLVNFDAKWKNMLSASTPVPTPRNSKYQHTVGVFEGGGYMSRGIYSPADDCRMKSNGAKGFCPVCQAAIQRAIDWNAE